jgi:hypothetical protein
LEIYKSECTAVYPSTESLKQLARRLSQSYSFIYKDIRSLLDTHVRVYDGNKGFIIGSSSVEKVIISSSDFKEEQNLNSSLNSDDTHSGVFNQMSNKLQQPVRKPNWFYLEQWPANYNYQSFADDLVAKQQTDLAQLLDYTVTFNWYKDISQNRFNMYEQDASLPANSYVIGIIGIKDTVNPNNHQIKVKYLPTDKVYEVHDK